MSRPEISILRNLVVIILCAGEGRRMKKLSSKIPKPLIKIPSINDKSILQINLENLEKLGLKDIFIVTGHLGNLINEHLKFINKNIMIIHSKEEYKKGPLNSFLEVLKSQNFQIKMDKLSEEGFFFVMPGDTIFELNLLREIFENIDKNRLRFNKYPFIFYRYLNDNTFSHKNKTIKIAKKSSMAIIEKADPINKLKEITMTDLEKINTKENMNQIIPLFFFPKKFIRQILEMEPTLNERTIRALMNKTITNGEIINAIRLISNYDFFDIDIMEDLNRIN